MVVQQPLAFEDIALGAGWDGGRRQAAGAGARLLSVVRPAVLSVQTQKYVGRDSEEPPEALNLRFR